MKPAQSEANDADTLHKNLFKKISKKTYITIAIIFCLTVIFIGIVYSVIPKNENKTEVITSNISQTSQANKTDINDCGTTKEILTNSPVALKDLSTIIPMGLVAPPGHIGPTGHMYYNFLNTGTKSNSIPAKTTIYSPGNMTITKIILFDNASAIIPFNSYRIDFEFCNQVTGYFIHVVTLSDKLNALMKEPYDKVDESKISGTITEHTYTKSVNIKMSGGEEIGSSGGGIEKPFGIDFGLLDQRTSKDHIFASPERWKYDNTYVCSLDYYTKDLSEKLYEHIGDYSYNFLNPGNPKCGSIYQDLPGTAQGMWFTKDVPKDTRTDPAMEIGLIHSNFNHAEGVFSLGGKVQFIGIETTGQFNYTPSLTGNVNVDFSKVKADGMIYCYQLKNPANYSKADTVILLQMTDDNTLKFGKLSTSKCGNGPWKYDQYIEYVR